MPWFFVVLCICFLQCWGLNLGPQACWVATLLLTHIPIPVYFTAIANQINASIFSRQTGIIHCIIK